MATAKPKRSKSTLIGLSVLVVILLACVGGLVWFYIAFTPKTTGPNMADAYYNSQVYVQSQLKAPSTAKFPYSGDASAVSIVDLGGNAAQVTAYVDAQNSFGAMIRQHYTATLKWQHDDIWQVTQFKFTD